MVNGRMRHDESLGSGRYSAGQWRPPKAPRPEVFAGWAADVAAAVGVAGTALGGVAAAAASVLPTAGSRTPCGDLRSRSDGRFFVLLSTLASSLGSGVAALGAELGSIGAADTAARGTGCPNDSAGSGPNDAAWCVPFELRDNCSKRPPQTRASAATRATSACFECPCGAGSGVGVALLANAEMIGLERRSGPEPALLV